MRIAFNKGGSDPVDEVIRAATRGTVAHCELLFANGDSFSSSQADGGTRFITNLNMDPGWTVIDIGVMDEANIRAWCETQLHKGYDWEALVKYYAGVPMVMPSNPERWFCSEICCAAVQQCGVFTFANPIETDPEKFELMCLARAEMLRAA